MAPFSTRQSARLARKDFLANDNALVEVFKELEKRGAIVMDSATATKLFDACKDVRSVISHFRIEDKAKAELNFNMKDDVDIESEEEEEEPEQPPKKTRRATRASVTAANEAKSENSPRKNGSPRKARSLGDS
ncbi:hypothetical protein BDZ89DRAFT_1076912 [Hymenopellis radicata]|nr:hypothetical protein BDZ89DRAFT_1076912 [Hymenopellis radicata]